MEKITKRNVYEALVTYANTGKMVYGDGVDLSEEDLKAFAINEIELLDKRAAKAKETKAKKQAEADTLLDAVKEALTADFETTADIAARIVGDEVSVSKVVYRLNKLVTDGVAEKTDMKIPASETAKARTVKAYRLV